MELVQDHFIPRPLVDDRRLKEDYRKDMLSNLTPRIYKIGLVACPMLAMLTFVTLPVYQAAPLFLLSVIICYTLLRKIWKQDLEIHALAQLSHVTDFPQLETELQRLSVAINDLYQSLAGMVIDRHRVEDACKAIYIAVEPLLARGSTTIQNAVVAGYKPYPATENFSMPDNENDRLSFHYIRIEASNIRLSRLLANKFVINESISQVAGEIIPPLRSIEIRMR